MPAAVAVVAVVAGGAAGTAVAGAVTAAIGTGLFATVASVAAGVVAGAVAGAISGGIVGAVTGQDIGDSMKLGAISGGLAGGVGGWSGAQAATQSASGQAISTTQGEMGGSAIPDAVAGTEPGGIAAGEIEAGTGNVAMNDATALVTGTATGADAVQITANTALENGVKNVGGMITKTTNAIKGAAGKLGEGLLSDKGVASMVQLGGDMLGGMGQAEAAKLKAKEAEKAATTAYERNKKKLQEGVDPSSPTFTLNKEEWKNSPTNPASVKSTAPVPKMAPKSTTYTNYKAKLDQGLLNA